MDPISTEQVNRLTQRERDGNVDAADTLSSVLTAGRADQIAITTPGGRTSLTFGSLEEEVHRLCGALAAAGVQPGDRVALMVPRGIDFVLALLAITAIGATAAPLNPRYTRQEFAFYLKDLGPQAVVVSHGEGSAIRQAAEAPTIDLDDISGRLELRQGSHALGAATAPAPARPDDIALLLHTSGTTSRPKQVPLRHRNLIATARAIAAHYQLESADTSFAAMPLFHVHGLVASVLAQLWAGGTVIVPDTLGARDFWSAVRENRVSWFSGSPTVLAMLLDRRPPDAAAPALRFARACSSALPQALADRIESELSIPILQAYGMTEASHQIASNPLPPAARDPLSVGLATGTTVTTLDAAGVELPAGAAGEVAVRGPGVISGYLNNTDANARAFTNGWFRTGDLGTIDHDGYIRLQGRLKELINRGGEKISPAEVEDALRSHPAVSDAACFAIPDAKYGESVGAAVVLREPVGEPDLRDHCRERLAPFKVPRTVWTLDTLPKTATGKVSRLKLAAELAGQPQ